MEFISDIACVAALGLGVQFVAAILGPRVLNFASLLLILGALAIVGGWALATFAGTTVPLIGPVDEATAVNFGILAGLLLVGHLFMRWLFRCMARCSQVA